MTAKEFFKSTVFKCIAALLCVLLVSGVFLTIMNGLLEVTEDEKFQRVLSSIYGKSVKTTKQDISGKNTNLSKAVINEVYKVDEDGNYIVNASGKNGYGGNVLCWVVILPKSDGKSVGGVGNVLAPIADNGSESFLSKINSSAYERFAKDYKDGIEYSYGFDENDNKGEMYVQTDASYSMRGICNAVNGTIQFMNAFLSGTDIAEEDPYEAFAYHEFINMADTTWTKNGKELTYSIVTKGNSPAGAFKFEIVVDETKTVKSVNVVEYGSVANGYEDVSKQHYDDIAAANAQLCAGKDLAYFTGVCGEDMQYPGDNAGTVISTGATRSSYLCFYAAAFAVANYEYILNLKLYTDYIDLDNTSATVEDGKVHYSVTTKNNSPAGAFKLDIVVNGEGKIETITVTTPGSVQNDFEGVSKAEYDAKANTNAQLCVGKDLAYFTGLFGEKMEYPGDNAATAVSTGATRSSFLCMYAGAFATANYSDYLSQSDGGASNE